MYAPLSMTLQAGLGMHCSYAKEGSALPPGLQPAFPPVQDMNAQASKNILFGLSAASAVTAVVLFLVVEKEPDPGITILPTPTGIEALVRF